MYGDTAVGRKRVRELREQALDIRALAERLVAQAEGVPWRGRAAESMRTRIKERASHLRIAAAQHENAAEALTRHLAQVDEVKEAIAVREHKATALLEATGVRETATEGAEATGDEAVEPSRSDRAFVAPAPGHKDWLTVELSGLEDPTW